jgi:hypothetical protein
MIDEGDDPDLRSFRRDVEKALADAANLLRREGFMDVPPKRPGTKHLAGPLPGGFYSNRQRNFVLAGINSGVIQVPYIRTGNLPRSWSISKVQYRGKDAFIEVFSDPSEAPYNRFVQDDELQVPMHEDWNTPSEVADKKGDEAMRILRNVLREWGFE